MFATETGEPIPEPEVKEYLRRCCKYAKHYQVWLVPERFVLMGYHCMCLIDPQGKVVGAQKALYHHSALSFGGKKSTSLHIFPTEMGSVSLCVDVDIYRPEVTRIAASMGAQIILCNQNIRQGDYSSSMVLAGAWNAAQLAGVYVVSVTNQFNCVCTPIPLSPLKDGFLCPPGRRLPMTQKLSVQQLDTLKRPKPLSRKLYALHRNELVG
jgi:hypothetical protein